MSNLLLVEDDPANRKLVKGILERAGHQLQAVDNAEDGLALARETAPDLIIMDVQLPGIDGLSATRALKSEDTTMDVPVLVLTAHAMHGDRDEIMESGCDEYMAKPVRYRELLAVVARLLGSQGSESDGGDV